MMSYMDLLAATQKIRRFYQTNQRMPSYKELADLFGFSSKKSSFHLAQKLIKKGILSKDDQGKLLPKNLFAAVPFLGFINAGYPSLVEEQLMEMMSFDHFLINRPERSFVLQVNGDSMIGAGINDGDLVIIEKDRRAKEGDVVAAYIDLEFTLKYLKYIDGKAALVPANPKYPIIYPQDSLSIWGVVISVIRKYH